MTVISSNNSFKKCDPRSLTKILGHPNLKIMFSYMKVAACTAVSVLTALASAHFVKYYMTTTM